MNYLNWLSLVWVVLFCGTGCGRSTDGQSQTITQVSLIKLAQDSNAYIRNNARRADACWKARDYNDAVTALRVILNLIRTSEQREALFSSMDQLRTEVESAAKKGDKSAKKAMEQFAEMAKPIP